VKKVLAILSEYGYWGIELVGPLSKLEQAGYYSGPLMSNKYL
jgi:hypothetical protein